MRNFEEIKEILKEHSDNLKQKFGVKELGIFGSYVRGEQKEGSDLDILVEFKEGYKTFDNYMDLKFYLEELLNVKVDLVSKTALKPRLKPHILKEVVYV
ncbi:nucleotidyltransferase [Archaeoglobales archaeon]|nr:MAG: nucleotidyltransferase [Archaeoglobales archaeon]